MRRRFLRGGAVRRPASGKAAIGPAPFADRRPVFEAGGAAAIKIAGRYVGMTELARGIGQQHRQKNPLGEIGDALRGAALGESALSNRLRASLCSPPDGPLRQVFIGFRFAAHAISSVYVNAVIGAARFLNAAQR